MNIAWILYLSDADAVVVAFNARPGSTTALDVGKI